MTNLYPPTPHVDPPGQQGYFTVLDCICLFGYPDSQIVVTTDVPVFLYGNFTRYPPSPIQRTAIVRGVTKRKGTFWAAQQGTWIHQSETGETSHHTYTVTGWPPGEPLWYWFTGYQNGAPTVSSSILFGSLRPGGPTPYTANTAILVRVQPELRLGVNITTTAVKV